MGREHGGGQLPAAPRTQQSNPDIYRTELYHLYNPLVATHPVTLRSPSCITPAPNLKNYTFLMCFFVRMELFSMWHVVHRRAAQELVLGGLQTTHPSILFGQPWHCPNTWCHACVLRACSGDALVSNLSLSFCHKTRKLECLSHMLYGRGPPVHASRGTGTSARWCSWPLCVLNGG